MSPLEGGLLGGVLKKSNKGRRSKDEIVNKLKNNHHQIEQWENYCDEIGEIRRDGSRMWLLNQPGVTAPIIGPRTFSNWMNQSIFRD